MIRLSNIDFGEIDFKNEFYRQSRQNNAIFAGSFQIPPGINFEDFYNGAKTFLIGSKGSGKTALLHKIKLDFDEKKWPNRLILFKTDLTETERQQLASGINVFAGNMDLGQSFDYKYNWMWFIFYNVLLSITTEDISEGKQYFEELKKLFGLSNSVQLNTWDRFKVKSIQTQAKLGLADSANLEVFGQIDLSDTADKSENVRTVIRLTEQFIGNIKLRHSKQVGIFFDELEIFAQSQDQQQRDIFIVRDLLYAISRANRAFYNCHFPAIIFGSVRSEVLHLVNLHGEEVERDVRGQGVEINWHNASAGESQPLLEIVQARWNHAELTEGLEPTNDVWSSFFPDGVYGKPIRKYVMDLSMNRPRTLVMFMKSCSSVDPNATSVSSDLIDDMQVRFSAQMWREVEEDLAANFLPSERVLIRTALSGWRPDFRMQDFSKRISDIRPTNSQFKGVLDSFTMHELAVKCLYRIGAIGNRFQNQDRFNRDRWIFRGYDDPLLDENFTVHDSLRKHLQLSFS